MILFEALGIKQYRGPLLRVGVPLGTYRALFTLPWTSTLCCPNISLHTCNSHTNVALLVPFSMEFNIAWILVLFLLIAGSHGVNHTLPRCLNGNCYCVEFFSSWVSSNDSQLMLICVVRPILRGRPYRVLLIQHLKNLFILLGMKETCLSPSKMRLIHLIMILRHGQPRHLQDHHLLQKDPRKNK